MSVPKRLSALLLNLSVKLREVGRLTTFLSWRRGLPLEIRQVLCTNPRIKLVQVDHDQKVWARVGRGQSDLVVMAEVWFRSPLATPELADLKSKWIIDAGANAGYTTRWLALRYPNATVIAIEPDSDSVQLLRRNTADLSNVMIEAAALTDTVGVADLVDVGQGPWAMRVGAASGDSGRVVGNVRCTSLDEIICKYEIDRIGLLKVDIEGGEVEVFRASSSWIDKVDAVAVELHDRFRAGCTRAFIDATTAFGPEMLRGELMIMIREPVAA